MHAARLVRPIRAANRQFSRSLSVAATTTARANDAVIPLSNVEAQWEKLTADEQLTIHQQLEELQKRDWKTLSLDEKKAGTYIRLFLPLHGFDAGAGIPITNSTPMYMQPTTSLLDPTDPGLISTLRAACQSSYCLSWPASSPEVPCTSRAEHSVSPDNARRGFFPIVLTAVPAAPPPQTMTKEWQEASNERARELNLDPITGKWFT